MSDPSVSVIVPLKGNPPALADGLRSIRSQDYTNYELIFVTESSDDPAVPIVATLVNEESAVACQHIVAGTTNTCAQKNKNLLAGIAASDPARTILVLCDGGHIAPPHWLKNLVAPIVNGEAEVATGYHRITASPFTIVSSAMAAIVSVLRAFQQSPALRQPWGGSTAITRTLFERLNISTLWSQHVVDDVSLARELKKEQIHVAWASEAIVETPIQNVNLTDLMTWLTRQLFFLRVYYAKTWLVGGVIGYVLTLTLLLFTILGVLGLATGSLSSLASLIPAVVFSVVILQLRHRHPNPGAIFAWLAGGWLAPLAACACHFRSATESRLEWSGIRYDVTKGGRVIRVTIHSSRAG